MSRFFIASLLFLILTGCSGSFGNERPRAVGFVRDHGGEYYWGVLFERGTSLFQCGYSPGGSLGTCTEFMRARSNSVTGR